MVYIAREITSVYTSADGSKTTDDSFDQYTFILLDATTGTIATLSS